MKTDILFSIGLSNHTSNLAFVVIIKNVSYCWRFLRRSRFRYKISYSKHTSNAVPMSWSEAVNKGVTFIEKEFPVDANFAPDMKISMEVPRNN